MRRRSDRRRIRPLLLHRSPAINAGVLVSRVGGSAQIKAMRKVAGSLRLELAAFREIEAFARLGADGDIEKSRAEVKTP